MQKDLLKNKELRFEKRGIDSTWKIIVKFDWTM
jgi:hypothetical protein